LGRSGGLRPRRSRGSVNDLTDICLEKLKLSPVTLQSNGPRDLYIALMRTGRIPPRNHMRS
jgi:hypothetical protein